jgi:NADH-quinone oxidoreductase subunit J
MTAPLLSSLFAETTPLAADGLERAATCPTFWGIALGAVALWLLIPGGRFTTDIWRTAGGLLTLVSGVLFAIDLPMFAGLPTQIMFWLLAAVTLGSGVAMISARNPLYTALWFALSLIGTSGLFLMQGAQFLGVATIVVYAGAIVVTFLFVIMLAQPEGHAVYDRLSWGWFPRPAALLIAAVFLGLLAAATSGMETAARSSPLEDGNEARLAVGGVLHPQHMALLGRELFSGQLVAVEVAGSLLMAALVGAIAIAIHGKQVYDQQSAARAGEELS